MASSRCRIASALSFDTGQAGRGRRGRGRRRRGPGVDGRRSNPRGAAAGRINERDRAGARRPGGRGVLGVLFDALVLPRIRAAEPAAVSTRPSRRAGARRSAPRGRGGGARRPRAPARDRRGPGPRAAAADAPGPRSARAPRRSRRLAAGDAARSAEKRDTACGASIAVARVRRPRRLRDARQGRLAATRRAGRRARPAKRAAVDAWEMTGAEVEAQAPAGARAVGALRGPRGRSLDQVGLGPWAWAGASCCARSFFVASRILLDSVEGGAGATQREPVRVPVRAGAPSSRGAELASKGTMTLPA